MIGSGIMGERFAVGNVAIALLANTIATGAALLALILTFGSVSGAHLNPAVTVASAMEDGIPWSEVPAYLSAQCMRRDHGRHRCPSDVRAALVHAVVARPRHGQQCGSSEFVATFGLLSVIWGCSRLRPTAVALAVASYITSAYWFTASTSFANPAVTIARSLSDTFAGIRPADVPWFVSGSIRRCHIVYASISMAHSD